MANVNNQKGSNPKENRVLFVPQTSFNNIGITPVESQYILPIIDFKKYALEIARQYCSDFADITFEGSNDRPTVCLLWIKTSSENVADHSMERTEGMLFRGSVFRMSEDMKRFVGNFCDEKHRQIQPAANGRREWCCVCIDIGLMLGVMFDVRGRSYRDEYGKENNADVNTRCDIIFKVEWPNDRNSYEPRRIAVRKTVCRKFDTRDLRRKQVKNF